MIGWNQVYVMACHIKSNLNYHVWWNITLKYNFVCLSFKDDNIIDQMLQLHCTCASLFSALVADKTSSFCSSCLISPNSRPTTATFPSTTYLGNMLTPPCTPPHPPPTYLPGFGTASIFPVQRQISTQGNCGGGELENPVRFTLGKLTLFSYFYAWFQPKAYIQCNITPFFYLGRTDKPHVRKLRQHRDRNSIADGSPSSAYSFRPFVPLNTCFTGETSVPPSVAMSSIFGIPEASVGEPVIQSSPLPITSASSFHTLFHTSGTPSETSTSWVGGGDRGHLAHQNPKYLPPRNYLLEFLNVRLRPTRRINSPWINKFNPFIALL